MNDVHEVSTNGGDLGRGEVFESLDAALLELPKFAEQLRSHPDLPEGVGAAVALQLRRTHINDAYRIRQAKAPTGTMFYEARGQRLFNLYDREGYLEPGAVFYLVAPIEAWR